MRRTPAARCVKNFFFSSKLLEKIWDKLGRQRHSILAIDHSYQLQIPWEAEKTYIILRVQLPALNCVHVKINREMARGGP